MNDVLSIRWDRILGAVGIIYLCVMLVLGGFHAPFSIDGLLRFNGARSLLNSGNPTFYDAGGNPIIARKWVSLPPYVPALFCVALGGGITSVKVLYAMLCLLCILGLGYVTHKVFGKRAAGFTIFVASMAPFVHQVAVDSARTEFLATILLILGIIILYQPTCKSRWNLIFGCLLIGLSTWVKLTLVLIMPAFVITGLLSGTRARWRDRTLSFILGPIIGIVIFWLVDLLSKAILFGGKSALCNFSSYWLTSSVHGTLGSTAGVSLAHKLATINGIIPFPIFIGIVIVSGFLLIREKCTNPLHLFMFLSAIGWIAWWLIFDSAGILRHLLVGFLFFCVLLGGFCAEVFRSFVEHRKAALVTKITTLWPNSQKSLAVILLFTFLVFGITSVVQDFSWLKWAMPMRRGQEQLAKYVAVNKEKVIFCSWGQISAYDISALSRITFWDISSGLPPDSLHRNRKVQLIVTAWQKKELASGFPDGLFPHENDLINSRCKLVRNIGENDVYKVTVDTGD